MENQEQQNQMEKDTLELVLEEFAEEQKMINQNMSTLIETTNKLQEEFKKFETEISKPNPVNVNTDTKPFLQLLQKGMLDIKLMIGNEPKSIQRKFQILLFPEQNAKLFYKIVFGRWFLWLAIMLGLINLYKWGVHYSDNQKEIEIEQVQNDRIRKSWKYLYEHNDKNVQSKMEKAYETLSMKEKSKHE